MYSTDDLVQRAVQALRFTTAELSVAHCVARPRNGLLRLRRYYSYLRVVLLYVNIVSYGTQEILAETARTRLEGAIRRLARWRAAGWENLPL